VYHYANKTTPYLTTKVAKKINYAMLRVIARLLASAIIESRSQNQTKF
jgi:hypothetical protein